MNLNSIKIRIVALSGVCVIIATGALVGYSVFSAKQSSQFVADNVESLLDRTSRESLERLAAHQSGIVSAEIQTAFGAARAMAYSLEAVAAEDGGSPAAVRRTQLNNILLRVLKGNPRLNGTYSAWAPDALDSSDAAFVDRKDVGSDRTGRALPYWTRDAAGKIALQPLVEYDSAELHANGVMKGGWFLGPQKTGEESILAPLPYIVQGKAVYLATISVPIMVNGKFAGVAGADFDLAFVQTLAEQVNGSIYGGKGFVTIVSNAGLVIADSGNPRAIGGSINASNKDSAKFTGILRNGETKTLVDEKNATLMVFSPLSLGRTKDTWSLMITEPQAVVMGEAQALSTALASRREKDMTAQIIAALVVAGAAVLAMGVVATGISAPIEKLAEALRHIARGETVEEIHGANRKDEIGHISRAVDQIRVVAEQRARDRTAAAEADRVHQENVRRETMHQLANQFEGAVGKIVETVSSSAAEMEMAANAMSTTAETTRELSTVVAAAAGMASTNVQSVAAASEEMTATITEISRQVHDSAKISNEAAAQAQHTNKRVNDLSEAAKRIGDVVNLIATIAGQTNLLALNATIEAARAGEAGRGFAVVATEVKSLAAQTARATAEISQQISAIQTATEGSVADIKEITMTIGHISEISTAIAAAVEQQGAASREIANSVAQAAQGTTQVASNIGEVQIGASQTGTASEQVLASARALSQESAQLDVEMRKFLASVRAA
jgi:methyl-accepting chemotaxis protein